MRNPFARLAGHVRAQMRLRRDLRDSWREWKQEAGYRGRGYTYRKLYGRRARKGR